MTDSYQYLAERSMSEAMLTSGQIDDIVNVMADERLAASLSVTTTADDLYDRGDLHSDAIIIDHPAHSYTGDCVTDDVIAEAEDNAPEEEDGGGDEETDEIYELEEKLIVTMEEEEADVSEVLIMEPTTRVDSAEIDLIDFECVVSIIRTV